MGVDQAQITREARLRRIRARVEAKLVKTDYCWYWSGDTHPNGRGRITIDQTKRYVYRVLYELMMGPIPSGWHLHHRCHNPPCINPLHLLLVTHLEHRTLHGGTNGG